MNIFQRLENIYLFNIKKNKYIKMGCIEASNESKLPTLLCEFVQGNEEQKNYCIDLKNNFRHQKTIGFEIKESDNFTISFLIRGKKTVIQSEPTLNSEMRDKTLQEAYKLLQ